MEIKQERSTRTQILSLLKKEGKMSMNQIAFRLGVTKMAVFKHITSLEASGLVERNTVKKHVGRPVSIFTLTASGKKRFVSSYEGMISDLISFLVKNDQRELVLDFLKKRYSSIKEDYERELLAVDPEKRLEHLAAMRDSEGYMAELRNTPGGVHELIEFNCPIFQIATLMGEACDLENSLFQSVLGVKVDSTHRQVKGESFCRFLIHKQDLS
jgi:DeoR family suf operon transcriptional repressor